MIPSCPPQKRARVLWYVELGVDIAGWGRTRTSKRKGTKGVGGDRVRAAEMERLLGMLGRVSPGRRV